MLPHRSAPKLPGFDVRGGRASISVGCRVLSGTADTETKLGNERVAGTLASIYSAPSAGANNGGVST